MRFKSPKTGGYIVCAVTGINSISFAVDFSDAHTDGLLGFAIERHDLKNNERYFMRGFKVFKEFLTNPDENTIVSTYENPVQSFVWDDFTGYPNHKYRYYFYPLKGKPKNLDRSARPIAITVQTEPLYSPSSKHDVFFNRGVASSQAYARKFSNETPETITDPAKKAVVLNWLARDLKNALITFIDQAQVGDSLFACFYEFRYLEIAAAFKAAIGRGVQVRIIIDAKANKEQFPRADNLATIQAAGIPADHIIQRQANPGDIQHNKFIILARGQAAKPTAVWTGSTNISEGGIFGQTNVGHWVRDTQTARQFKAYWDLLATDPGATPDHTRSQNLAANKTFKQAVAAIQPDIAPDQLAAIPRSITPIFSPRPTDTMLHTYAELLDSASSYAAVTLAFGINDAFKQLLVDNTAKDQITFMLLEKKDRPRPGQADKFTALNAGHNVYQAFGSYIKDPLYQWTKEVNNQLLQLNQHVLYIHSKFMLVDPLGPEPIVVTGSANFSTASTTANDENMLIIRSNKRVSDIYFTEFNRLFNHYYFRSVYESHHSQPSTTSDSLFLLPDDSWLAKYKPGTLRYKRVMAFHEILS